VSSSIRFYEAADGCLNLFAGWSEPEQVARRGQLDERGPGDGSGVILCVGESDTGIMA
jgi:hypothetical protein